MHWIVQNNLFREDGHERLVEALARRGVPHSVVRVIPFARSEDALDPDVRPEGPVVVMGSYTLSRVASDRGWAPGAWTGPGLDFEVQVRHWEGEMLNAGGQVFRLADVPEQVEPFFARPTADSKAFVGQVFDWEAFASWRERLLAIPEEDRVPGQVSAETWVLVAPRREIWTETRFWIVRGRVVTASLYKLGSRVCAREVVDDLRDPGVRLAHALAQRGQMVRGSCPTCGDGLCAFQPDLAYCLDIANTPEGPKIVEVNCLNAAGFYAADLGRLVEAVETASPLWKGRGEVS